MSCKLKYNPEDHFIRVNALLRTPIGVTFINQNFEDADAIIAAFNEGKLESYARASEVVLDDTSTLKDNLEVINAEEEKSFSAESQYFRLFGDVNDSTRYFSVLKEFKDRIMSTVIFDKASKSPIVADDELPNGHTVLNTQLALYKIELAISIADSIGYKIDDKFRTITEDDLSTIADVSVFNNFIQSVLFAFENHPNKLNLDIKTKDAYFKLSEFNRILSSEFDWIVFDENLVDPTVVSIDMYEIHDPKGKHRRSFNTDDAMQAAIDKYTSNYMRRLLDFIPEASEVTDSKGEYKDLEGTHIGFVEFCHAISTVYDWALNDSSVPVDIRNEAIKWNKGNVGKVIKAYLDSKPKNYSTSHMSKLRGLYKYIYSDDTYIETRNLFVNQIEKTIKTDWMVYTSEWDPKTKSYKFVYKTLTSTLVDAQKQNLASAIKSTVYLYRNNYSDFAKTFQGRIKVEPESIKIYGLRSDGPGYIELFRDESNADHVVWDSSNIEHIDSEKTFKFISDLLGIDVSTDNETLRDILSQMSERNVFEIFSRAIGHTIRAIHDGKYIKYDDSGLAQEVSPNTEGSIHIPEMYTFERADNWCINLKNYLKDFDNSGIYLNRIFGSEQYNVLKDLHGNNVPYFQLGSYMHDVKKIANSIGAYPKSPYFNNIFVTTPKALGRTVLRSDVQNGSVVLKAKEMSGADIMYLSITQDLFGHLIVPNSDGTILVQPTCNADKSKFDLREINLKKINMGGNATAYDYFYTIATEFSTSTSVLGTPIVNAKRKKATDAIENEIIRYRRSKTKRLFLDSFNRLKRILNITDVICDINENSTLQQVNDAMNYLHSVLRNKEYGWTLDKIEKTANQKGIAFYPESDLSKGIDGLQINDVLEYEKDLYWESGETSEKNETLQKRWNYNKLQFAKNLRKRRFSLNLYRDDSLRQLMSALKLDPEQTSIWFDKLTGEIKTHIVRDSSGNIVKIKENELYKYDNSAEYTVELNPVLEAWFYSQNWFAQSLTDILYGDQALFVSKSKPASVKATTVENVLMNYGEDQLLSKFKAWRFETKGKVPAMNFVETLSDDELYRYKKAFKEAQARESEASRTATMFKRNMIGGSTRHNLMPQTFGTDEEMIIANLEDFDTPISDLFGKISNEHAQDGAGYSSPYMTILENWSYMESSLGKSRKTIWGFMDPVTGHFHEIKWAVFTITNETRLNSMVNGDYSFETAFQKMHNMSLGDASNNIDLTRFWNKDSVSYSSQPGWHRKKLTIESDLYTQKDGRYYKLDSLEKQDDGSWTSTWSEVSVNNGELVSSNNGALKINRRLDTLYDIDQIFGGAFASEWDYESKSFVSSELNNIIVANIICEHDLKQKFIGYLVPHQAMKVSVRNRNSNDLMSPSNTENFTTYKIKLSYGGAQMDAEHEVEGGDVAEMMQTIAALVQNGYMMEEAFDIYDLIGQTIRESIPEFRKAIDKEDGNKVDFLLGKALIDSLSKETSGDKLGLAGAFIRRAEHLIRTHASKDIDIPFSANSIKGKFISEVASKVNKAIKRRCPGLGTVQAPSYRIMSHFEHNGQVVSYRKLLELLQDESININGIDIPVIEYVSGLYSGGQLSEYSAAKFNYRDPARSLFDNQMIGLDGSILNPFIKKLSDSSRKTLKIEDTVVVRKIGSNEEGQVITLKDLRELDFFQNIIDTSQFEIYVWQNQSRELRSSVTEVTLDTTGIKGLAKSTISTNEFDVNRALFYIYEYFDDQNLIVGKEAHSKTFDYYRHLVDPQEIAEMQLLEDARKMEVIRRVIDSHIELSEYRNMSDVELKGQFKKLIPILKEISQQINIQLSDARRKKKEVNLPVQLSMISSETSLEDVAAIMSAPIRIKKVNTRLPQIIAGRAYLSLLGIGPSDNVWDITGPEYFESKIREADKLPSVKEVPTFAYDCECTLEDGRKVLVKLKNDEAEDFINQDNIKVGNKYFSNHIGSLMYGSKEVCDGDGINAYTYYSENGNDYNVLIVNTIEDFKRLIESGYFNYVQYNYTVTNYEQLLTIQERDPDSTIQRYSGIKFGQANTEKIPFNEIFKSGSPELIVDALREDNDIQTKQRRLQLANERWIAYKETLKFIGARIPTQSMQSFSGAEIVMFSDVNTNECWLPRVVTWIEGSDYDIDKWYLWGLGLNPNGTIATLSDTYRELGVKNSFKLGIPHGRTFIENDPSVIDVRVIKHRDESIEYKVGDVSIFYNIENKTLNVSEDIDDITLKSILNLISDNEFTINGLDDKQIYRVTNFGFRVLSTKTVKRDLISEINGEDILIPSKNDSEEDKEFKLDTIARVLSKVTKSGLTSINFINCTPAQKKYVLRLLNNHTRSRRSGKTKELALKNATFFGIQEVVSDPITQINLHMPIAMEAPKAAANASPLAAEESVMCIDDPSTVFIMQEANMSGKNVVGIGATSLKGFFNATAYYNMKALELLQELKAYTLGNQESGQRVYEILSEICFDSKFKEEELRSLSNIYWEPILKFIKEYGIDTIHIKTIDNPICSRLNGTYLETGIDSYSGELKLASVIEQLAKTSKYNNCADDISAVISAATDNAKELILSKLNATEQFADIYTYLLSTGETFADIAEFMTSPIMGIVQKFAKPSFLVPTSKFTKVRDVINFVLDEGTINPIPESTFNSVIIAFFDTQRGTPYIGEINAEDSKELVKRAYELFKTDDNFIKDFKLYLNDLYINASEYVVVTQHDPDTIDPSDMLEMETEGGFNVQYTGNVYSLTKTDISAIADYVENTLLVKNEMLSTFSESQLALASKQLYNLRDVILPGCEEQQKLGALLSINKGIKTDDYEEYSFIMSFQSWINSKCAAKKINEEPFDFLRFVSDEAYRKKWINVYEKIKVNKNILAIVVNTPHFKEMLGLLKVNRYLIERSAAVKLERKIASRITEQAYSKSFVKSGGIKYGHTQQLNQKEFTILKDMVGELIPFTWLTSSGIKFLINDGDGYYDKTSSLKTPVTFEGVEKIISISNPDGIATFKHLMDIKIIPMLRKKFGNNKFIKNLKKHVYSDAFSDLPVFSWVPVINMSGSDLTTDLLYNDMLAGFDEIAHIKIGHEFGISNPDTGLDFTIGDLFFLYDLIINKGGVRRTSYTRFFENQVKLGRKHSLNDQYHRFIVDLDKGRKSLDDLVFGEQKLYENFFFNLANLEQSHYKYRVGFEKKTINRGGQRYIEKIIKYPVISGNERHSTVINLTSIGGDYTFKRLLRTIKVPYEPTSLGLTPVNDDKVTVGMNSAEVLNEIANYFNVNFGTKVPFKIVTREDIIKLIDSGEIIIDKNEDIIERHLSAEGFINNGITYINASAKGVGVHTMFHEILHVICAAMKFHKSYQKLYYRLLDMLPSLPNYEQTFEEIRDKYGEFTHGSDLKEEVLVALISKAYQSTFESSWKDDVNLSDIQVTVNEIMKSIFKIDDIDRADKTELGASSIGTILKIFNSKLLNPGGSLYAKTRIPMGQKLAKIKQEMIDANLIKYSDECY